MPGGPEEESSAYRVALVGWSWACPAVREDWSLVGPALKVAGSRACRALTV